MRKKLCKREEEFKKRGEMEELVQAEAKTVLDQENAFHKYFQHMQYRMIKYGGLL